MRTSAKPSLPFGSGSVLFKTPFEKVQKFGTELVTLLERAFLRAAVDDQLAFQVANHFICRVHFQNTFGADRFVTGAVRSAEAARELRQAFAWEAHQVGVHFRDFPASTCWQNAERNMRGSPIFPARTAAIAERLPSSKCSR